MGNPSGMDDATKGKILADLNRPADHREEIDYTIGLPDPSDRGFDEADVFGDRFYLMRPPPVRPVL